jgi:transcriptional regulator with XRE-family HTH domain
MSGAELKSLRKDLGLSLSHAARQVEVSTRTWARWEAGNQDIPAGALKLFRIVNHLAPVPPRTIRVVVSEQTVAVAPDIRDTPAEPSE